jgi:multidrug efflux system membrane fusion protein
MRIMPLVTAGLVLAFLYFWVIDRDQLMVLAGADPVTETTETADVTEVDLDALIKVVVRTSQEQSIENAVILRGRTEAARSVVVRAETNGAVISEPLRKGAYVNQGDLLCEIEPGTRSAAVDEAKARLAQAEASVPQARASLPQAEAQLREAEVNLNAARTLKEDGYATETRVLAAEAAWEAAQAGVEGARSGLVSAETSIISARAALANAELELSRVAIHAPFAGLLESDTAELGSFLSTGADCATIIQLDTVKLVGFVPELEVGKITVGAPAMARLADGTEVTGRVTFLSRSADETTRTFRTEIEVQNADLSIRDGQTADIIIGSEGRMAHLVPQSALTLNDDGDIGLRTIDASNTVAFYPIEIVRDTINGVWVTGLPATIDIIVLGQEYVIDGVQVNPTYQEVEG